MTQEVAGEKEGGGSPEEYSGDSTGVSSGDSKGGSVGGSLRCSPGDSQGDSPEGSLEVSSWGRGSQVMLSGGVAQGLAWG